MPRAASTIAVLTTLTAISTIFGGLVACSSIGGRGDPVFASASRPTKLAPKISTRVYRPVANVESEQTADIYLTDLPLETFRDPAALASASGQLIHVHMFLEPKPGRTPIEPTACTATVRYFVLAEGRIGVYSGGGFLLPKSKPGDERLKGTLADATLRLTGATPGFADQIGSGELAMNLAVPRDDEAADILAHAAARLALTVEPVAMDDDDDASSDSE